MIILVVTNDNPTNVALSAINVILVFMDLVIVYLFSILTQNKVAVQSMNKPGKP